MTSATYRQSSAARVDLVEVDPDNRLLARQSSLRISAELVRDAALATSGLLSRKYGGPSVRPPQPESVTQEAYGNKWQVSAGEDRYRRGLYTFIQRTSPFAQTINFDAPNPSESCPQRERSNTPLQALQLLNDPVFFEAAEAMAERLLQLDLADETERAEYAFRLTLARPPRAPEVKAMLAYLDQQRSIVEEEAKSLDGAHSVARELAVWTGLSSVLLNLHEFITRG